MAAVEVELISEEETERLKKYYPMIFAKLGIRYVRTQPGSCVLFEAYERVKDKVKSWHVRQDDTLVQSFPKAGSTWVSELVWCLQNDCNIEKAKSECLVKRVPWFDEPIAFDIVNGLKLSNLDFFLERQASHSEIDSITMLEQMPSPRIFKSHLPFYLLPDDLLDKCKVIVCLRNPKDTVVSYFHHERLFSIHGYDGDFSTYFDLFMEDLVFYSPYFGHVADAWKRRHHQNICILFYEDMKLDLASNIRSVAKFLGKEVREHQVEYLMDHLSFEKIKENRSVNMEIFDNAKVPGQEGKFIRKGQVGDWKNYFTGEMNRRMDEAIEKHFKPIGLEFRYE